MKSYLLTAFFFVPLLYADSQYECGAHGRFEYCIDAIPGCVIGCHCHPGYYFDTDSKICEPNIKLTQDFRRQYLSEPTRVHVAPITSPPEEQPITTNAVDEKIDEITKDADDLGDWLYNQFFKTIENQVINKTQGEELPPTRRSGDVLLNKPERRSYKYWKGRKKKKKKSKGLKSKLLRITEDDSLFESESGSSSHDEYSSSSSESDDSIERKEKKKNNDDHGHKKIIIFNKKPQPPLPSFIFLPNMDTPYYPPIGLNPPPAMPMYPMVPVPPMLPGPPMGGPLFPYPGPAPKCEEDDVSSSTSTTTTSTESSISTTPATETEPTETTTTYTTTTTNAPTAITTTTEAEPNITTTSESSIENENTLRHRHKKRNKSIGRINYERGDPINPLSHENRNKQLWKRLREKLNRKKKLENYFVDQYQEPDAPMEGNDPSEFVPNHDFINPNVNEMRPSPDVDFKYLAELIHKADLNKTLNTRSKLKPNSNKQNQNIPESVPIVPSRRNYYPNDNMNNMPANNVMRRRSRMEDPNDSFYTNLGKQIAAMISKVDLNGEREVNIEIEGANSKQQSQTSPVFNENNYASRSYWERSVRSPLKYLNSFNKEMDYLKKSNENLFSLENKVEVAASTVPTLSLNDLENIISTVEKVKLKPKRNNIYTKKNDYSNASFKLNLLPGNIQTAQPNSKPKSVQTFTPKRHDILKDNNRRQQVNANNFLLSNFRQLSPDYDDPITNTATRKDSFQIIRPTRKPSAIHKPNENALATHLITNMMPTFAKGTDKSNLRYQLNPVLLNHRSLNYHNHNQNQYSFGKALPIQYSSASKSLMPSGRIEKPSYFHHEFHHFDYFDK